jgi:PAS domain S-box-containing protein
MAAELRKTGISVVGDMPWGTHVCHFYETKQDLLDILLPYFKAGLEHNEFCVWVICEPLSEEEARNSLRHAVPAADRHLAAGDIEIVPHTQWYLKDGVFDQQWVINGWHEKLAQALTRGYAGMRVNGNEAWLEQKDWTDFSAYEQALNAAIANHPMIVLCTYPLAASGAAAILDVARTHEFAIAKRHGMWEVVETPELKQAKEAIKRLNEELEQRVIARTSQLTTAYEALQREIAERTRTDEALREREIKYRSLFESSHDVILLLDTIGNILEINRRGEHVTGYSQSELLHMNVFQHLVPPEDHSIVQNIITDLLKGQIREYEVRWRTKTGRIVHLDGASIPRFAASGEFLSTLCTLRDITERKRAAEALRESEARLRLAMDAAHMGAFEWDLLTGKIIWSSDHAILFGLGPHSFSGMYQAFDERVHPEDRDVLHAAVARACDEHTLYSHEYRIMWPDSSVHWIAGQGQFFYDTSGKPMRMCGLVMDITERKYAEAKLRQSEAQLAEAQHLVQLGSWSRELATNVVTWSDELFRIFGMEPQEVGTTYEAFLERVHPDDRAAVRAVVSGAFQHRQPFSCEYRIVRPDGVVRVIHERGCMVVDDGGNPIRLFGTAQDITERKRAEEQLQATSEQLRALSARLRSAREEEGARIARALHDELGSALTSLKWDLEEIDKTYAVAGSQGSLSALRAKVVTMTNRIDNTINTVRMISSELRPRILDDLGLVAAIEWQAQQFQARTGIICQFDSQVEHSDLSQDQATAIFRIFQEAMTNILRHAQATRANITIEEEEGAYILEVRDNGRGITEEERTGSRSLGLLGMRERAQLIGGTIDLTGLAGKGTVLTVRMPIPSQAAACRVAHASENEAPLQHLGNGPEQES